ncbi:MAG TPA: diacylglycerol kinase family protein [Acidimicrobiia bacterium]|nr:diacylglycerol kinase family protein [Acidimicrobiia bacterium]
MSQPIGRRVLAVLALLASAAALVLVAVGLFDNFVALVVGLGGLAVATMAMYVALVSRRTIRWVAATASLVLVLVVVFDLVVSAEPIRAVLLAALWAVSVGAGRAALHSALAERLRTSTLAPVSAARRPVLVVNPRSGGGKAERFSLVDECGRRGVGAVVLRQGDDLEALAEQAAASGADVVGMAGGDGSQALVSGVAARHGIAHVCVPSGTRNHLALDLGLDRDDVVGALDAYGDGLERTIDLATVNGLTFVNNVSLGLYAAVVEFDEYRDAKVSTTLDRLPDLLGKGAEPFRLRFTTPSGDHFDHAHVIHVSNNPYAMHAFVGGGSRPRLDGGVLGVTTLRIDRAADVPALVALVKAGRVQSFQGYREWTATAFRVDADEPVRAGVDGEAMSLTPPLLFEARPGAVRVRVPHHASGLSPGALAEIPLARRLGALVRVAAGRPV